MKMQKQKRARGTVNKKLDAPAKKRPSARRKTTARNDRASVRLTPRSQQASDKAKRGRRTTPDNHLVGSRNGWLSFLEKIWHEIGWHLLQIRNQGTGTMDDVRRVFELIRGKPECHWADSFLRGLPQAAKDTELRANRIRAAVLHDEINEMQSQQREMKSTCAYAEIAVQQAGENEKEVIQSDASQKKARLEELKEKLGKTQDESNGLDEEVRGQETYFYCSQLLDFLCKGKYAVKPLPLANSLAGLPQMGWRQSLARCSKMPRSSAYVQYPYGIFQAISKVWKRRSSNPELSMIDLFQTEIPRLRKKDSEARTYLSEGWRDLRMTIEHCSKEAHNDDFVPFVITQIFVNNRARTKNQTERILDERERLAVVT